jgi:hypothetical protein
MPKEYVDSTMPHMTENGVIEDDPFRVKVSWNKETGDVQIATINPGNEYAYDEIGGYYVDLDRTQINRLIKVLRRARDQAFGRDE